MSMPPKMNDMNNPLQTPDNAVSQNRPVFSAGPQHQPMPQMQQPSDYPPRRMPLRPDMNAMPRRVQRPEGAPAQRMAPSYNSAVNTPQQAPVKPMAVTAPKDEIEKKRPVKDEKKKKKGGQEQREMFGTEISFAAKEAYKLLRTNLMFALSGTAEGRGHIVGVTSSLRGEGKSTTTLNLASVLAEQGKRVVVVEGDLRLPSLKTKLDIRVHAGLSHVLIGREHPGAYLRQCQVGMLENKPITFDILLAGEIPPNPSELLGSRRMEEVLDTLASEFDFVILDLPPVTAVSDALVATKLVDGVVLVVRNEYADTGSLNEAIRQIHLVDGKILGFVFTCANSGSAGYRKKYKYHSYYNYSEYR